MPRSIGAGVAPDGVINGGNAEAVAATGVGVGGLDVVEETAHAVAAACVASSLGAGGVFGTVGEEALSGGLEAEICGHRIQGREIHDCASCAGSYLGRILKTSAEKDED